MEVCPTTGKKCIYLTAARNLKQPEIRDMNDRKFNKRLAQNLFDKHHENWIDAAQKAYCSDEHCGLDILSSASTINHLALADVQVDFLE